MNNNANIQQFPSLKERFWREFNLVDSAVYLSFRLKFWLSAKLSLN